MRFNKLLLALPMALALTGCVIVADGDWDDDDYDNSSSWRAEQNRNRENITHLTLGLAHNEVLERMGRPNFTEAFTGENGNSYQILFYRTHRQHGDGETSKDETTPLVFEDQKLIGWGNDALQRVR